MSGSVVVRTPCRLHFGMFSFGQPDRPQFGGVGAMIEPPCVEVSFTRAERFEAHGALAIRAKQFVELATRNWGLDGLPACAIEVRSPGDHTGLGVGTQLGLAVAAGLRRFLKLPELSIETLAASVGRGRRSAIGTYGFQQGGLIVDAGKEAGGELGKLSQRVELPSEWRFVLVRPPSVQGRAGENEAAAFASLPPVSDGVTRELWRITNEQMLPAVERADCEAFGEAVFRFGTLAGECFAGAQGGVFASSQIATLVAAIRSFGVAGTGQSSWGPTVFAVVADDPAAQRLSGRLQTQACSRECDITIAKPNNLGATITST